MADSLEQDRPAKRIKLAPHHQHVMPPPVGMAMSTIAAMAPADDPWAVATPVFDATWKWVSPSTMSSPSPMLVAFPPTTCDSYAAWPAATITAPGIASVPSGSIAAATLAALPPPPASISSLTPTTMTGAPGVMSVSSGKLHIWTTDLDVILHGAIGRSVAFRPCFGWHQPCCLVASFNRCPFLYIPRLLAAE